MLSAIGKRSKQPRSYRRKRRNEGEPRRNERHDMKTPLTAAERETVILLNDEDDVATITTHQRRIITALEKNPAATKTADLTFGAQPGAEYVIPVRFIRFGRPRKANPASVRNLPHTRENRAA